MYEIFDRKLNLHDEDIAFLFLHCLSGNAENSCREHKKGATENWSKRKLREQCDSDAHRARVKCRRDMLQLRDMMKELGTEDVTEGLVKTIERIDDCRSR